MFVCLSVCLSVRLSVPVRSLEIQGSRSEAATKEVEQYRKGEYVGEATTPFPIRIGFISGDLGYRLHDTSALDGGVKRE